MNIQNLIDFLDKNNVEYTLDAPMKNHTTFKIGGNADVLIFPCSAFWAVSVINFVVDNAIPYFILGNGSNLLVSDKGIEGAVISLEKINSIKVEGEKIVCGAGAMLRSVCVAARDNSLSGLEFAYGIPGTMGGAFYMNAGAYGGEIAFVAENAVAIDKNGNTVVINNSQMDFGYRKSIFKEKGLIILFVTLSLKSGNPDEIAETMNDIFKRRVDKQPLDFPSAGSTFKRPEGYFAGALIEENGFKGFSVNGAAVSEKHAGFVINKGNATASDVLALIKAIKEKIKTNNGVDLETEVIFVGKEE